MVYRTLQEMGADVEQIFSSINELEHPVIWPQKKQRYHNNIQHKFWQLTEQITQDPHIGLRVGQFLPTFRGQFFEYLFLSSPRFADALNVALQHYQYFTTAFDIEMQIKNDIVALNGFEHPVRHYLECTISIVLSFLNYITGGQFKPAAIWLTYDNASAQALYETVWKCPVYFNMPRGCIRFDAEFLNFRSDAAEADLFEYHQAYLSKQMDDVAKQELIFQIEAVLHEQLPSRCFTLDDIAKPLGLQPRKIQQALKDIGTSYEQVLNEYREKLARQLLAKAQLKQEEIVYLTGFSESSAFSRAFKYWTGETPSQYRKRLRQKHFVLSQTSMISINSKAGSS